MALNRPLEAFLTIEADDRSLGQGEASLGGTKRRRIALLGMRGVGKSTLGRLLSRSTGRNFIELDREIEKTLNMPLASIFAAHGPNAFRAAQLETLKALLEKHEDFVLTTGGSLVEDAEAYDLLRETCVTVWLTAGAEDHFHRVIDQGDLRPMTGRRGAMNELKALLAKREPLYRLSDVCLDTSQNKLDQSLARLLQLVGRS